MLPFHWSNNPLLSAAWPFFQLLERLLFWSERNWNSLQVWMLEFSLPGNCAFFLWQVFVDHFLIFLVAKSTVALSNVWPPYSSKGRMLKQSVCFSLLGVPLILDDIVILFPTTSSHLGMSYYIILPSNIWRAVWELASSWKSFLCWQKRFEEHSGPWCRVWCYKQLYRLCFTGHEGRTCRSMMEWVIADLLHWHLPVTLYTKHLIP